MIVIDPFLTNNPKTPPQYKNLDALGKVDVILVTHGHGDHVGDVKVLAETHRRDRARARRPHRHMVDLGWVSPRKAVASARAARNPSRARDHDHPGAGGALVGNHCHRSGDQEVDDLSRRGAGGFIIEFENGFKIYHMGDTGLFGDMKLIGEYYKPDLLMIPIGGHFVMDPRDAAYATKEMLKPKYAIPFHYGTFPVLKGTPHRVSGSSSGRRRRRSFRSTPATS